MIEFAAQTDKGRRFANEDSYILSMRGTRLIGVADGMGGHAAGKLASSLTAEGILHHLGAFKAHRQEEDPVQCLLAAIRKVNLEVFSYANSDPGCRGMGTTLTLAMLFDDKYVAANIGDSRLYHFDGWTLTKVTHDHSLVAVLVANGSITEQEAHVHPQRNIITRALGTSEYEEADFFQRRWSPGDILLACSDGLHGSVMDDDIAKCLREDEELDTICDNLIRLALENGATDNITAVLARHTGGEDK